MLEIKKFFVFAALGTVVLGCGDEAERDWTAEVILQLFKPLSTTVGKVTIAATQRGKTRSVAVNTAGDESFFASCTSNRVRIIPVSTTGMFDPLTLVITTENAGVGPVTVTLNMTGKDMTKKVALGAASAYMPSGTCSSGLNSSLKELGTSCSGNAACKTGLCLKVVKETSTSTTYTFSNGYCSKKCLDTCDTLAGTCKTASVSCATDDQCRAALCTSNGGTCFAIRNASQLVVDAYCMRPCQSDLTHCKRDSDKSKYQCTPGNVCMPK